MFLGRQLAAVKMGLFECFEYNRLPLVDDILQGLSDPLLVTMNDKAKRLRVFRPDSLHEGSDVSSTDVQCVFAWRDGSAAIRARRCQVGNALTAGLSTSTPFCWSPYLSEATRPGLPGPAP